MIKFLKYKYYNIFVSKLNCYGGGDYFEFDSRSIGYFRVD